MGPPRIWVVLCRIRNRERVWDNDRIGQRGDNRRLDRDNLRDRILQRGRDGRLPAVVAGQNQIAAREHARRTKRGIRGARLRQRGGESGRLFIAQLCWCNAEVGPARLLRAPHPRSPLGGVEIQLHDAVLAQDELEPYRGHRLLELPKDRAGRREIQILRQLLGDGARAAMPAGPPRVLQLDEVDPVVRFESRIFGDDDHALEERGRMGRWVDGPPICQSAHRAIVAQSHHRGAPRLVITPPHRRRPHREQPHDEQRACH